MKKPAVKIIIDSKGKAEFLNKNGEVVDGTSGNLMETESSKETPKESHNIDEDIEKEKMTEEEESNGGTEGNVGEDVAHPRLHQKRRKSSSSPKLLLLMLARIKVMIQMTKVMVDGNGLILAMIEDENPVSEVLV